jgi:hypothetical protein
MGLAMPRLPRGLPWPCWSEGLERGVVCRVMWRVPVGGWLAGGGATDELSSLACCDRVCRWEGDTSSLLALRESGSF